MPPLKSTDPSGYGLCVQREAGVKNVLLLPDTSV
jgi:hypothetical protein